jgi:hypothetical protein
LPIFAEQISHPIGSADMEFYEGGIVLRMALLLSGYDEARWEAATYRTRQKWLDRGNAAARRLLNDSEFVKRLPLLTKNLTGRL